MVAFGLNTVCGQTFENMDVKEFASLTADSTVVVLDVRKADEYTQGHIRGAVLIDQFNSDFVEQVKNKVPKDKTIAVYCRSGRRSANAATLLANEGYKTVNLKGGIMAWMNEGQPFTYFLPTDDASTEEDARAAMEVYLPKKEMANGCAVILCPGGAMRWLSWESDVVRMASFLNERGIAAMGLRYHLNKSPMRQGVKMPPMVDVTHPDHFPQADANPMHDTTGDSILQLAKSDAMAAIRIVREHADQWNVGKDKIGFLGFSAGGGVAIAATISATDDMERPNFLSTNFGPSLMPVSVPVDAPPLLIMTRADHPNVAAGLVALFMEWKKSGANAEMHIYGDGKGPYELMPQTGETTTESWSSQLIQWLSAKGFLGSVSHQ